MPTAEPLFVPALRFRHLGPFVECPSEARFGGPLQRALIERTFLEGPLFVHSSANKGPL